MTRTCFRDVGLSTTTAASVRAGIRENRICKQRKSQTGRHIGQTACGMIIRVGMATPPFIRTLDVSAEPLAQNHNNLKWAYCIKLQRRHYEILDFGWTLRGLTNVFL